MEQSLAPKLSSATTPASPAPKQKRVTAAQVRAMLEAKFPEMSKAQMDALCKSVMEHARKVANK
jgi:hypothetical protein